MKHNDLTLYDAYAKSWWDPKDKFFALRQLNIPRFEYFDRFVSQWKGVRVLDVGCGGGFTAELLASRGAIVSGIDQSHLLIEAARIHSKTKGYDIDYRDGVGEKLPFADGSFDAVVCVDVLEHVDSVEQVVSEIARVLKPGGVFLFDTINRTFKSKFVMIWLLENILREIPRGVHDWNKFIKPEELTPVLSSSGFVNAKISGLQIKGKDKKSGRFKTSFSPDKSLMYIGVTTKG
jgi:2-polyprenyl-6-hydroxyphenyl methylase/3-demethylubiquinone-9 3-methyltransferase